MSLEPVIYAKSINFHAMLETLIKLWKILEIHLTYFLRTNWSNAALNTAAPPSQSSGTRARLCTNLNSETSKASFKIWKEIFLCQWAIVRCKRPIFDQLHAHILGRKKNSKRSVDYLSISAVYVCSAGHLFLFKISYRLTISL